MPIIRITLAIFLLGIVAGCAGQPPTLGTVEGHLKPCPATPNCVSSQAEDLDQQVAAFHSDDPLLAWQSLQTILADQSHTEVITINETYLHAEVTSAVFGFIDDIEFLLQAEQGLIQVRSASRLGYSDLGVNRNRVDMIRQQLTAVR